MRPQFRCFMPGRYANGQRTPLSNVDLEEPRHFLIGNILKRLWLENAEVCSRGHPRAGTAEGAFLPPPL